LKPIQQKQVHDAFGSGMELNTHLMTSFVGRLIWSGELITAAADPSVALALAFDDLELNAPSDLSPPAAEPTVRPTGVV
jgi:hypothetical protein